MEPKILTMGKEQDYFELRVSRENLKKNVSKMVGRVEETYFLEGLEVSGNKISANKLIPYGGTLPLQIETPTGGKLTEGLESFFGELKDYAKRYEAPYVLVQQFEIKETHLTFKISGLMHLLVT